MKIAIIYTTSNRSTKKSCEILSGKLNSDVKLISIENAKTSCLLKYNFIILVASALKGKVQNNLKLFISRNKKNLKEKPIALAVNCEQNTDIRERLNKAFTEEMVESSYANSNFGYELDPDEGNFLQKRKINNKINEYKKEGKSLPTLNLNEIDKFADIINNMIKKRVD